MAHITTPVIGTPALNVTHPGTTTNGENTPWRLGDRFAGTDGQEYIFVQAGGAISTTTDEPYFLCIDENYQAVKLTQALAKAGHKIGVAPEIAIADNDFFWAITKGSNVNVKVAVSCAADVQLYTTATAGVLDDTSGGSHANIAGIRLVVAASASQSAGSTVREAILSNPVVVTPLVQ